MPTPRKVLLLIESSRAYERALLRGIARYAHLHGPWIFFREAPYWEPRSHRARIDQMRAVDGMIVRECADLPEMLRLGKPTVVSNSVTERIAGPPNIVSDHRAIGVMAADHLIERGFRHFAFCGYRRFFWSNLRLDGFRRRVARAGGALHLFEEPRAGRGTPWKREQPFLTEWLQRLPKPVGLMACIDERSQQVADACHAAGIAIPDQVAVIGADNDEMICTLSTIPLSSVAITAEQGGYEAARRLDAMMRRRRAARGRIEIRPGHVVTRASTDVLASADPHVSRAARFIAERCREPLYVADIARASGLSRRVLEKRFRSHLSRSVNDYIRQCRVRHIGRLLADSDMTIAEIAIHMGFPDAAHIGRYFRRQTNTSPAEYRRRCRA